MLYKQYSTLTPAFRMSYASEMKIHENVIRKRKNKNINNNFEYKLKRYESENNECDGKIPTLEIRSLVCSKMRIP